MKRKYIIPTVHTYVVVMKHIIADSPDVKIDDTSSVDAGKVEVKEQHTYNVWDDDWGED